MTTREQKDEMLQQLRANNLYNSTASDERERKIWMKAFEMYNGDRGTNMSDTTCNKCCELVRDWLEK